MNEQQKVLEKLVALKLLVSRELSPLEGPAVLISSAILVLAEQVAILNDRLPGIDREGEEWKNA